MSLCPCNSSLNFSECCEPIIYNPTEHKAKSPLALMRSRYTAYVIGHIDHIIKTHIPNKQEGLDFNSIQEWSANSHWNGLSIIGTEDISDSEGHVEFIAHYQDLQGKEFHHHEKGHFIKKDDTWYYLDGEIIRQNPITRVAPKVGRNDPCSCGSGKKFKKCCGK